MRAALAILSASTRRRLCGLAAALALCALLAPVPALCAESARGMAQDLLDVLTKSPAKDKAANHSGSTGQTGPVAPAQPRAPVVPGAPGQSGGPAQDAAPSFAPRQDKAPRQQAQPGRASAPRFQDRGQVLTLRYDGLERRALLTLPKSAALKQGQAGPRLPLIVFLHGAGSSAAQAMRQTGLAERAAAAGFLAVFPEGLGPEGEQTWNAWMCCGYARDQRVDDVGFLSALIGRLCADYDADPKRVYLAGFSNGAMLASRFVLERPGVTAGLAVAAGYLPCDVERPADRLPVLIIHGARDQVARFAPTRAHPATGRFCEDSPARAQVDDWVRGMELSPKARVRDSRTSPLRVEDYASVQRGGRGFVRFVIVKNGGHAWPGGQCERYRYCDLPSASLDATGLVLDFFRKPPAVASAVAKVKTRR
ncbi:MAG: PHB depolymerase family esterase [Humidesulfovibrio sp.]|nr:PHB depolymerase family esterase [Humidesulfovibrio sp.]